MQIQYAMIGNAVVDIFRGVEILPALDHRTDNTRVSVVECADEPGGNAINTGIVLAKISDVSIAAFSAICNDHYGKVIGTSCETGRPFSNENLLAGKINLFNANADNRDATGTAVVLHERATNRTMFIYNSACNARVDVPFLRANLDTFARASFLHISGFGGLSGIDRGENLTNFIELLRGIRKVNAAIEIILDVMFLDEQTMRVNKFRENIPSLLDQVDYFVPNELEAMQWSSEGDGKSEIELDALAKNYNCHVRAATIIKRGPRGVTIFPRGGASIDVVPAKTVDPSEIIDTVGAGDAWCAGFLDILGKNTRRDPDRLIDASKRGNQIAAISLLGRGGNAAFFSRR